MYHLRCPFRLTAPSPPCVPLAFSTPTSIYCPEPRRAAAYFPLCLSSSSGGRVFLLCAQLFPVFCAQQRRFEMDQRTQSKARPRSISGKADRYPPERRPWWFACCWNVEDSRWPGSHPRSLRGDCVQSVMSPRHRRTELSTGHLFANPCPLAPSPSINSPWKRETVWLGWAGSFRCCQRTTRVV